MLLTAHPALDSRIDEFGRYVSEYYGIMDDIADPNLATEVIDRDPTPEPGAYRDFCL